ncbi:hypothetical protein BWQ96_10275 [Gracilariopsis chorda]|uniref:C2H2-type domain-containing protein n=1 Tax=Gracilariopsis chorda TaxID=448386 RepID=A0A2V3ID57_9FLOR|nr:hypothetical protein BWQ96_10275 [Gracilariopsis chorda]|eukprot:PXF40019.1 hypothetical protein BWQ96_10275 [Gracilariopsis chorda]
MANATLNMAILSSPATPQSLPVNFNTVTLGVHDVLHVMVCVDCQLAFRSKRSMQFHLRHEPHYMELLEAQKATNELHMVCENTRLLGTHPLFNRYDVQNRNALQDVLPPLFGLRTELGLRCPECGFAWVDTATLQKHISESHNTDISFARNAVQKELDRGRLRVHSVFRGTHKRSFAVTNDNPVGSVLHRRILMLKSTRKPTSHSTPSQTDHTSIARDTLPQIANKTQPVFVENRKSLPDRPLVTSRTLPGTKLDTVNLVSKTQNAPYTGAYTQHMETFIRDLRPSRSKTLIGSNIADEKCRNYFIQSTKLDLALESLRISMEDAVFLSGAKLVEARGNNPDFSKLSANIVQYMQRTPSIMSTLPPFFLHSLNQRTNFAFKTVRLDTLQRYALDVARLLFFVANANTRSHDLVPKSVAKMTVEVITIPNMMKNLHASLKACLLQSLQPYTPTSRLLVRNFVACASVLKFTDCELDKPIYKYAAAEAITHLLAALQYAVAASAIHELHTLGQSGVQNTETNVSEMASLTTSLDMQANTAFSFIRNTLNVAMSIARKESLNVSFLPCTIHTNCGIVKDVHLSLSQVGNLVQELNTEIESVISNDLLDWFPFPPCSAHT